MGGGQRKERERLQRQDFALNFTATSFVATRRRKRVRDGDGRTLPFPKFQVQFKKKIQFATSIFFFFLKRRCRKFVPKS